MLLDSFRQRRAAAANFDLKAFEPEVVHRVEVLRSVVQVVQGEIEIVVVGVRVRLPFRLGYDSGRRVLVGISAFEKAKKQQ